MLTSGQQERKSKQRKIRNSEYYDMEGTFDRLYAESKKDKTFNHLMEIIENEENIRLAYRTIKKNTGSDTSGVDKRTIADLAKLSEEEYVRLIRKQLDVYKRQDQDTAVIEKEISVTDERQKVSITVEKQDAEIGNTVAGAVFGIYNAKDIQTKDGKVIVKADTLLQEMTSDEKGQAACTLDLPLGSYYVKELKAPDGFVSSDEVLRFDASYQGQDVQTVTLKSVKKNQPTTVEITKSDATTGVELDGAYLKVTDKDGNVVDSWTSSKDAPHVIKYLKVGETYTLHEEFAPHGYLVANDVTFTVKDTGEVQKVEMKDEVPVGELIINKKGEFLDSVTLADKVKGVVEHIFNYVTGKLTDVTFEVYAEEDIKAADGVSDDYCRCAES